MLIHVQFHSEKNITSAIERYRGEVDRVLSVINLQLEKTGKPYLVGDKCTFADLMFIPWNVGALRVMGEDFTKEVQEKYPKFWAWHETLMSRPAVKKTFEIKADATKSSGH